MECDELMTIIKKYKWSIFFTILLFGLYFYNNQLGQEAINLTWSNVKTMLSILPAIFILIGLMDVWIPKETMIRYMGQKSGISGILIALVIGSVSAGPLYVAFPIAALLLKKGARLAYVLFFLGAWVSSKLPIMIYEIASFGYKFTLYHVVSSLIIYLVGSIIIEKLLSKETIDHIYTTAETI